LLPFGAPGDIPPCIRQRPFGIAGDRHRLPLLVRAPHRGLWFRLLHPFPCHELKDDFDRGGVSGAQQYGRARLVDQHELASVARAFAATRPVHTVTELCATMSRQPLQVRRLPRAAFRYLSQSVIAGSLLPRLSALPLADPLLDEPRGQPNLGQQLAGWPPRPVRTPKNNKIQKKELLLRVPIRVGAKKARSR
jgi:hypothetical protein